MERSKLSEWMTIATNVGVLTGLVFFGFEYRQNNQLIEIERAAYTQDQINSVVELAVQDMTLIELMGKDQSELTQAESDRLTLLGIRMLLNMQNQFNAIVESGASLQQNAAVQRAIYNRPRLNYGIRHAWPTFKARGENAFTRWFEENVIGSNQRH